MRPIAGGRENGSPGWAYASSSLGYWEYPNTAPGENQPGPESIDRCHNRRREEIPKRHEWPHLRTDRPEPELEKPRGGKSDS